MLGQSVSATRRSKHYEGIEYFMTNTFKICILFHMMRSSIMRCMGHAVYVGEHSNAFCCYLRCSVVTCVVLCIVCV